MEEVKELKREQKVILVIFCSIISMLGKYVAKNMVLPFWLDTIGICVAAYLVGPVGTAVVGVTSNLFYGVISPTTIFSIIMNIIVGEFFCFCAKKGYLDSLTKTMISSFFIGGYSAVIWTPINLYFSQGKCSNEWGEALFDMMSWYELPHSLCAFCGQLIVDVVDKQLSAIIAFYIIRKILQLFEKQAEKFSRNLIFFGGTIIVGSIGMVFLTTKVSNWCLENSQKETIPIVEEVNPQEENEEKQEGTLLGNSEKNFASVEHVGNYVSTVFDSSNGLVSSEANEIAHTPDGHIWIGGYAGLTRYDGSKFEFITENGITSVTALMTDRRGRLWIGTNDNGIARYENGKFEFFTKEDGLSVDSIRTFLETKDGEIYIGTTGELCKIDKKDKISIVSKEYSYVKSLAEMGEFVIGVTNDGCLFALQEDKHVASIGGLEGTKYNCVMVTKGGIFAGTSGNIIEKLVINENTIRTIEETETGKLTNISKIVTDRKGYLWICAVNGLGYLNQKGELWTKDYEGFESCIVSMIEDYEGNLWFSSSRCGVMKLSQNCFVNLFAATGIKENVVNAVCQYDEAFFCGTDMGLEVIDTRSYTKKEIPQLTKLLSGIRIRGLMVDSKENLWICTYGLGLISYNKNGEIHIINQKKDGTTGDRFRCIIETADGTLVAGTSAGIDFIKDNKLIGTITAKDGLENQQILSLVQDESGDIYAGSDGAGIYRIREQKIVENISVKEGLPSQVVLRLIPYKNGYFVVCSNSLCFMEEDKVTVLEKFPYFNNYDVLVYEKKAYILASSGLYVAQAEPLSQGKDFQYILYNYDDGLRAGLTANSWNFIDKDGVVYFCTNKSVCSFDTKKQISENINYKISVTNVTCDDKKIIPIGNTFKIPAEGKNITIDASLRNYTLSNMKICFYVKGVDKEFSVISQWNLESKHITDLKHGNYKIVLQVLNNDESVVLKEVVYDLCKEAHIWEYIPYHVYLFIVMVWIVAFFIWAVTMYVNLQKRKIEISELRQQAKSEFLAHISHEIRTPVNAVIGMNDMILQESTEKNILEYARNADNAGRMLLGLINDILDFSAIEVGKIQLQMSNYRLDIMVNDMVQLLKSRAEKKGLEVRVQIDETLPAELIGDELRVKQVVTNLLTNAVKYTQEGSVTLKVTGKKEEAEEKKKLMLCISVIDTGMGIRKEDKEKLFESFQRLDTQKNHTIEGAGLGLNITKELVDLMEGVITVESQYGEGSVFTVEIPQEIVGETLLSEVKEGEEQQQPKRHEVSFIAPKAKVLVVDDNEMNLKLMQGLLKYTKIQIDTAMSGRECIQLGMENKYHIIFMDHMMPQMDGVETLHHIKEESLLNKDTPVVILTANAVVGVKEEYEKKGFSDYLSKPVDMDKMKHVLLEYLPKELIEENIAESTNKEEMKILNKEEAIRYCSGDEELYQEILQTYVKQSEQYIVSLYEYFCKEDWKKYEIVVHALHSTSFNVGARVMAEKAGIQEKEAKKKNSVFLKKHFEEFMECYRKVIDAIQLELSSKSTIRDLETNESNYIESEEFISKVWELLDAIEHYEMFEAIEQIDKLEGYRTKDGIAESAREILGQAKRAVDEFDYEDAKELITLWLSKYA